MDAQFTCTLIGIATGVLCARLFKLQGYALVVAHALVMGALFAQGVQAISAMIVGVLTARQLTRR
ncbi:hypothetical protein ACGFYT_29045 [Streptomyces sp. NPDC048208]|uniref:hypothetical protein n=1 Tax=unclassified Streptomyces TaxID=2593676 RepID=UPI003717D127